MNFLIICTVSRSTLISIGVNDKIITKSLEFSRHSENLFPLLTALLEENKLSLHDFDCFGCVIGPGSFTGIRIGMSVIKAFAFALNKPVFALGSLELLAQNRLNSSKTGRILAVINAGAGMVYHQAFVVSGDRLSAMYQPKLDTFEHFMAFCEFRFGEGVDIVYCQNDEKGADYSANLGSSESFTLDSLTKASINKICEREFTSAVAVAPLYLRVSSAEQNIRDVEFVRLDESKIDEINALERQNDEFDLPWSEGATLDSMQNPDFECYGLINKDGLWGMISVMNNGAECEILRVIVRKSARELGLGRKMLNELITLKSKNGYTALLLEVDEYNFPAIRLYASCGFLVLGERPRYYHNRDSAKLMKLKLN